MAAAAQTAPAWPSPMAWLRDFLREELAPYPGRGAMVARMVFTVAIYTVLVMTFQIPSGAFGAIYALLISRESPEATVKAAKMIVIAFAAGAGQALLGAMFFSGEPLLRVAWVVFSFFLIFFLLSALTSYLAALAFGFVIMVTVPIWDLQITAELKVEDTLWVIGVTSLAMFIAVVVEVIYARLQPHNPIVLSLTARLRATAVLLRSWADGIRDPKAEEYMTRLGMLGTSRMRRDLEHSGLTPEYAQRMGAIVALTGRLVELAAAVPQMASYTVAVPDSAKRDRLLRLAAAVEALSDRLFGRDAPMPPSARGGAGAAGGTPLLTEMEGTVDLIVEIMGGGETPYYLALAPIKTEKAQPGFFQPDAFSDRRHLRFAIRGCLAAIACYVLYNLVQWPGIFTSVVTCFVTALTTVGASRQKQVLRFTGVLVGGVLFGFGAQIFILPGIDSITGFLLVIVAVSLFASWFVTSGPRLSYFGVQVAVGFFLINLQEFKFQTSLSIARDRIVGVLVGLAMMWLIFDQLWSAPAAAAMRRAFLSGLRMLAQLMRQPVSSDVLVALDQSHTLRDTIHSTFENLRQQADGVALEFGPTRDRDLALRSRLLNWTLQLRIVYLARMTLLKYRLHLPGFELPPNEQHALEVFENGMAAVLDAMADRLEGQPPPPGEPDPHALFEQLETAMRESPADETPSGEAAYRQTFVPLTQRVVGIVASLREEMESSGVPDVPVQS
jgi:multidrug resistance protein MdtO